MAINHLNCGWCDWEIHLNIHILFVATIIEWYTHWLSSLKIQDFASNSRSLQIDFEVKKQKSKPILLHLRAIISDNLIYARHDCMLILITLTKKETETYRDYLSCPRFCKLWFELRLSDFQVHTLNHKVYYVP